MKNVPKKPDERQMTILNAIHKKINYLLQPLIIEAAKKQDKEKKLELSNQANNKHKI